MSTSRVVRQIIPLIFMIFALAIFTSLLFRTKDVSLQELELSSRFFGQDRSTRAAGEEQDWLGLEEGQDGLTRASEAGEDGGMLVEGPQRDWGFVDLSDEDLTDEGLDAILKSDWVYDEEDEDSSIPDRGDYRELFSLTTHDRRFFPIFHEKGSIYDPTILPHPARYDVWIVVAQNQYPNSGQTICQSGFLNGILICDPLERQLLPIQKSSVKGACSNEIEKIRDDTRPHDARMFYGPDIPYILYAAPSHITCYNERLQDGRRLLSPFAIGQHSGQQAFKTPMELHKPAPYKSLEKNHFLFWDLEGKTYVHHDLYPERVFAELDIDGSVGANLASIAMVRDQLCMAKYLPRLDDPELESIQQATNSLSLTLCKRKDPFCKPTASNTYLAHIFHVASTYDDHLIQEPYMLLFEQTAPFALAAISQRPYWIHGRDVLSANSSSMRYFNRPEDIPEGHTERFGVTGMSWKTHGQKYHGHIDDVLLLSLGIEDSRAGGIDVLAGDLVEDLAFC